LDRSYHRRLAFFFQLHHSKKDQKVKNNNFFKTSSMFFLLIAIGIYFSGCAKVPAGNVGVKVYLVGTDKGIDHEVLGVGYYWMGWNTEMFLFPTFQQNYTWTQSHQEGKPMDESFTFQTREGLSMNCDLGISYHLQPDKISLIFQKYRRGVDEITDTFLRNMVRDALNQLASRDSIQAMIGNGKQKLLTDAETMVRDQVKDIGIIVDKLYLIGEFRLPAQVKTAINAKIEATQKAQQSENELQTARAEAAKAIAVANGEAQSKLEIAKAEAEANAMKQKTLTAELIRYETIRKWDGHLPQVTGGSTPFISMDFTKEK